MHFSEKFNSFCLTLYGVRYLIMRFFCLTEYGSEKFERFACSKSGREGANARLLSDCGEKSFFFLARAMLQFFTRRGETAVPGARPVGKTIACAGLPRLRIRGIHDSGEPSFGGAIDLPTHLYFPVASFSRIFSKFVLFIQSCLWARRRVRVCARVRTRSLSFF